MHTHLSAAAAEMSTLAKNLLLSAFSPALSKHVLLGLNANKCAMIGRLITAIAITNSNTH